MAYITANSLVAVLSAMFCRGHYGGVACGYLAWVMYEEGITGNALLYWGVS
jgi:hypothetical protein